MPTPIKRYLDAVRGSASPPRPEPGDEPVLRMIARLVYAGGSAHDGQEDRILALFPGEDAAARRRAAANLRLQPLDLDGLAALAPSAAEREQVLALAEAVAAALPGRGRLHDRLIARIRRGLEKAAAAAPPPPPAPVERSDGTRWAANGPVTEERLRDVHEAIGQRIDAFLAVLRDPDGPPLAGAHPFDGVLRRVVVSVLFADRELTDDEMRLGLRLFPNLGHREALGRLRALRSRPLDADDFREVAGDPENRRKLLQLVHLVASVDGAYGDTERAAVERIQDLLAEVAAARRG